MQSAVTKVKNPHGIHLRSAAGVVNLAKQYKSRITLCHNCRKADTCSILEVLALGAIRDAEIEISAVGPDEKEAVKRMEQFFSDGAGI